MLLFTSESFVFPSLIRKHKSLKENFSVNCCFVWLWNMASHIEGSRDYWVFGLCPSFGILKNAKNHGVSGTVVQRLGSALSNGSNRVWLPPPHVTTETDPISETSCSLEYQTMDKVQKGSNPEWHALSSEDKRFGDDTEIEVLNIFCFNTWSHTGYYRLQLIGKVWRSEKKFIPTEIIIHKYIKRSNTQHKQRNLWCTK
jgi:hypothetical protein